MVSPGYLSLISIRVINVWDLRIIFSSHNQVSDWNVDQLDDVADDTNSNETDTNSLDDF